MPIRSILRDQSFGPEEIDTLVAAFEDTLRALGLVDRDDPLVMTVAILVIDFAKQGERDPVKLRENSLKALHK